MKLYYFKHNDPTVLTLSKVLQIVIMLRVSVSFKLKRKLFQSQSKRLKCPPPAFNHSLDLVQNLAQQESCTNNKLHEITPILGFSHYSNVLSRNDSEIVNRLKIGHSRLTHSYLSYQFQQVAIPHSPTLTLEFHTQISGKPKQRQDTGRK